VNKGAEGGGELEAHDKFPVAGFRRTLAALSRSLSLSTLALSFSIFLYARFSQLQHAQQLPI